MLGLGRKIGAGCLLTTMALATVPQAAMARDQDELRYRRQEDNTTAMAIGVGLGALVGVLIADAANSGYAAPAQQIVQQPATPTYVPLSYYQAPPTYQASPTCTIINGYAACIGPDGNWQYVR